MQLRQSFKILEKKELASQLKLIKFSAPLIARYAKPGQFVILMVRENGERIPLTIADKDDKNGTITVIFQEIGMTTKLLGSLAEGDCIYHVLGPLGKASPIRYYGNIIAIGGGVGIAELYPVIKALKMEANKITTIIGARSKKLLILEEELKKFSHQLYITTDDGSYGKKGLVSDVLRELLATNSNYQLVYTIGPVAMMKAVADLTRPYGIKTIASLNPVMVDGTGMCGSCRVTVADKVYFACVHGPDFDAHNVNFDELLRRSKLFEQKESSILQKYSYASGNS